jgi:hypothetical protein
VALGVDDVKRAEARELSGGGNHHDDDGNCDNTPPRCSGCEPDGGEHRQRGGNHDNTGRAELIEQRDQRETARGRAQQIGCVQQVDARREPRERQRDHRATGEERERRERVDGEHQRQVLDGIVQPDADADETGQRDQCGEAMDECARGQQLTRADRGEALAKQVNKDPARTQSKQSD